MSFLATTLRTTASATPRLTPRSFQPLAATGSALSAPFHTSQPSLALRETDKGNVPFPPTSSLPRRMATHTNDIITDRDNVAEYYDAEKHDQLKATKEKKADWRQELASESESNVSGFYRG